MSAAFLDLLQAMARFSDEEMGRPWSWPGHAGGPLEVRDAHWRLYEAEAVALLAAPPPAGEPAAIMDSVQAAFGDLRGLLAGQPDHLLDADPGTGEWTLRQVLAHTLLVDRRYARQVGYAASRAEDEPVYLSQPLELQPGDELGGARSWLERLAASRAEFDALGRGLPQASLTRPTRWVEYEVDVRFRLHRAAAHLAEHTIQAEKVLRALGQAPAEAREIARRISALRGAHEFRTPAPELDRLDRAHLALAASISATP